MNDHCYIEWRVSDFCDNPGADDGAHEESLRQAVMGWHIKETATHHIVGVLCDMAGGGSRFSKVLRVLKVDLIQLTFLSDLGLCEFRSEEEQPK